MQPAVLTLKSFVALAVRWLSAAIPAALIVATVVLPPVLLVVVMAIRLPGSLLGSWPLWPLMVFHGTLMLLGGWLIAALWMTVGISSALVLGWLRRWLTGRMFSPAVTLWLGWAAGLLLLVYKWRTGF